MYQVFRNKRVMCRGYLFNSFEEARQFLRRHIRQRVNKGTLDKDQFGYWDSISRGPSSYTGAGYTIRKVA